jgi:hypothetical protein
MDHERDRLKALGIDLQPRWIAIENNGAGFDIQSYDSGQLEPIARLIEVKSSTQSPPRMIITRNEWETAARFGERYFFHVWSVPGKALKVLSSFDVEPHIPQDHGSGRWSEAISRAEALAEEDRKRYRGLGASQPDAFERPDTCLWTQIWTHIFFATPYLLVLSLVFFRLDRT